MTRSVRIHEFGDADVLRIEDIVTGEPSAGEVRLRVHAIGLNRTEVTLRSPSAIAWPWSPPPEPRNMLFMVRCRSPRRVRWWRSPTT